MNYSFKNITRIKNISNKETGRAYINDIEKEFILHYPDKFRNSVNDSNSDELIVLYQRIPVNGPRYITHLVRPIDNEIIEVGFRKNYKFGHLVETIAFTSDQDKIAFESTELSSLDFRNRGWGNAQKLESIIGKDKLEYFQKYIWDLFIPYFHPIINEGIRNFDSFLNDELDYDFESKEGKQNFILHRIRERDCQLTSIKKEHALKNGEFYCEVCKFSFLNFYKEAYLECHHKIPIHLGERVTRLNDLALVCANCHRMLHRKIDGVYLSIEDLRKRING